MAKESEKIIIGREKLAGYFYNISQLTFAAMILGGLSPLFGGSTGVINWLSVVFGLLMTIFSAYLANRILKS